MNVKSFLATVVFIFLAISSIEAAEKTYKFTIINENNETKIEGSFKGGDSNGDGWIDKTELTNFSEIVNQTCLRGKIQRKGWKEFVEEEDYPKILHTLQDVKKFRFRVHKRKKGDVILEFKTNTDNMKKFAVRDYLFWRQTELKENGTQVVFLNGVSDGKEGIVFCMSEAKNLRIILK